MGNKWVGQSINDYANMVLLESKPKEKAEFIARYKASVATSFIIRIVAMSVANNLAMGTINKVDGIAKTIMATLLVIAWLMYINLGLEDVVEFTSKDLVHFLKQKIEYELEKHKIKDSSILKIDEYIKKCISKNGITKMSFQNNYKFDRYKDRVNFSEIAGIKFFYIKDKLVVLCDDVLMLYKRETQGIVHMEADFRIGESEIVVMPERDGTDCIAFVLLKNKQRQSIVFEGRDIGI